MVDMEVDATKPNDDPIVMERNKVYGTKNTTGTNEVPDNTQASTSASTDRTETTDTCTAEMLHVQAERSNIYAKPIKTVTTEEGNQASIEYMLAILLLKSTNNILPLLSQNIMHTNLFVLL